MIMNTLQDGACWELQHSWPQLANYVYDPWQLKQGNEFAG